MAWRFTKDNLTPSDRIDERLEQMPRVAEAQLRGGTQSVASSAATRTSAMSTSDSRPSRSSCPAPARPAECRDPSTPPRPSLRRRPTPRPGSCRRATWRTPRCRCPPRNARQPSRRATRPPFASAAILGSWRYMSSVSALRFEGWSMTTRRSDSSDVTRNCAVALLGGGRCDASLLLRLLDGVEAGVTSRG